MKTLKELKYRDKDEFKIPKATQDIIPIKKIYADGIFFHGNNKFSKCYKFTDINYSISSLEDKKRLFLKYSELLNSLDSQLTAKITIINRKISSKDIKDIVLISQKNDSLQEYRNEYNNSILKQINKTNNFVQNKYITISINKKSIEEARNFFNRISADLINSLNQINSKCRELNINERLEIIHDFYAHDKDKFSFNLKDSIKRGHSFKDFICSDTLENNKSYLKINNKYNRTLYLKNYATYLKDSFISELTESNKDLILSIDIIPVPLEEAIKEIQNRCLSVETNITNWQRRQNATDNFSAVLPYDLELQRKESKEFLEDLTTRDQKMFLTVLTINLTADSLEQLNNDTDSIISIAKKHLCNMSILNYQQLDGLNTCLPYGVRQIDSLRTLTTESLAVLMPFRVQEINDKQGIFYGINAISKNMIVADRLSLLNANSFILGVSGSGKSFIAKSEIIATILKDPNADVIIIDPEREYTELTKKLNGQVIDISATSENHINALDMNRDYNDKDNPIVLKSEFILSLCEMLMGKLSPIQKSLVDRCITSVYKYYEQSNYQGVAPTLQDFYEELVKQPEKEAKEIALSLELFVSGNLNTFAKQTNVNIDSHLICYDILELGKQLKGIGMLVILDNILNRITLNRSKNKNTFIFIDEIYLLFQHEYSANFLFTLWKRARKYGAALTGITQNVEDILQSFTARTMLSNSEFIIMLNQSATDRNELAKLLNISDLQLNYITNVESGHGLIKIRENLIPFENEFDNLTNLYKLMTTKLNEKVV